MAPPAHDDLTAICWLNHYVGEQEPQYFGWFQNGQGGGWDTWNPIMNGTDTWVIATRDDPVVPEPSSLVVSGVAIGLLLLAKWRIRQVACATVGSAVRTIRLAHGIGPQRTYEGKRISRMHH